VTHATDVHAGSGLSGFCDDGRPSAPLREDGAALPDVTGFDGPIIVVVIPFERTEEAEGAA
jgi:hypothetical protein